MSELQKVIKYCAMGFAAFLAFGIITGILTAIIAITGTFSGIDSGKAVDINKSFEGVESLLVEPGVGSLHIKRGDSDMVEVVAENVSENFIVEKSSGGKLKIKGRFNFWNIFGHSNNGRSDITVYLPDGFTAEEVEIDAGAGNINIEALTTRKLDIDAGAGNIEGSNIIADRVELDGGVGEIDLKEVELSEVDLDCGVGNINLQGGLYGKCKLECGVGEVSLDLTESADDYDIRVEKGLGTISIDGEKYSDIKWNNRSADNSLDINGGVGNIEIDFEN